MVQRRAPFPACVMPRVCLRRHGFEKTKTSTELLKVLIRLGQDCPNPTLLGAGVSNARIPSTTISGRGIQVTLDKQQGLLSAKLISDCRYELTDAISVHILLASFDRRQAAAEERVWRSGSVRDHQTRGHTGRILGNILPQQRGNSQGLVLCPVRADMAQTQVVMRKELRHQVPKRESRRAGQPEFL
eukprot:507480-Rhodomonas_salina.1